MNSQAWGAGRRPRWAGPPATCTCTCPTSTRPSGARSRRARRSSCPSPTCSGATATARWRIRPATGGASPRTRKTCRRRRWPSARRRSSRRWASRRRRSPMQDVHVTGGGLDDAINDGVRQGYREGYLRASIVRSPFDRVNTGDNTPAVIHVDVGPGATVRIMVMAKGGGCENRSKYKMLTPAEGVAGVKEWIIECVKTAGPDACPPLILGVGVGGTFEKSAILSKKALFRELGSPNPDPQLDALEKDLLDRANRLGIGPQGYGGDTTAFGIHILTYPCHITSLPVAVTIECHAVVSPPYP